MINAIGIFFILSFAYRETLGVLSSGIAPEGCQDYIKLDFNQLTFGTCLRSSIQNGTWYHFEYHSIEDSCYECESGLALMGKHPEANGYSKSKLGLSDPDRGCFLKEYGVEVLNCPHGFIYKFEELPECSIKHELCLVGPKSRVKRDNPSSSSSSSSSSASSSSSSGSTQATSSSSSSAAETKGSSSSTSSVTSSSSATSSSSSSASSSSSGSSTSEGASSTSSPGSSTSSSSSSTPVESSSTSSTMSSSTTGGSSVTSSTVGSSSSSSSSSTVTSSTTSPASSTSTSTQSTEPSDISTTSSSTSSTATTSTPTTSTTSSSPTGAGSSTSSTLTPTTTSSSTSTTGQTTTTTMSTTSTRGENTTHTTSSSTSTSSSGTTSPTSSTTVSSSSTSTSAMEKEDDKPKVLTDSIVITDDEDVYGITGTGGKAALTCVLTSSRVKRIFWYKEDELQGGAEQTWEKNFSEDYDADVFTVTSIFKPKETAVYKCSFEGIEGKEPSVQVYILEPFIKKEDIFQRKDKSITMHCFAPRKSDVAFFKGTEQMTKEGVDEIFKEVDKEQREGVEWVKYEKVIKFARLDQNEVVYSCKAEFEQDQVVVDHSFVLEIVDAVVLAIKPSKETFYAIDAKAAVSCVANTKVIGEITWFKKVGATATKIEAKEGVYELKNDVSENSGNSYGVLTIVSAKKTDSALYYCQAEEVKSPEVSLQFFPVVEKKETVKSQEGETVSLTCSAPEGAVISFFKNNVKLTEETDDKIFTKVKEEKSDLGDNMFVYEKVIQQVKLDRNGEVFKCTAVLGTLTVLQQTFTLKISKIASLEISKADKYYKAGSKVSLVCTANKELDSKITWWKKEGEGEKQVQEVSNSVTIREALNTDKVTASTLSFLSAKEEHSGTYYCKGEEKKSTNEMTIMIFVTKDQETALTVNAGVLFTMKCWTYKKNFELLREGEAFTAYTFEKDTESSEDWVEKTLKLSLTQQQGGKFECVSKFDTFKVSSYIYNIEVKPLGNAVITPAQGYPMQPIGQELKLTCNLVAIAEVKLMWQKDNKDIEESKYTNTYNKETSTQNSILTLSNVQKTDSGSYTCQTVNRGSASSVNVAIYDPTEFTFKETKFEAVGTDIEFACYSVSSGKLAVKWAGKDVELTENNHKKTANYVINGFTMDRYDVKYKIGSVEDAGAYGCSATAYGNIVYSLVANLDVYAKPEIKIDGMKDDKSYTTIEGSSFTVNGEFLVSKDVSAATKMTLVLKRENEADKETELTTIKFENKKISSSVKVENVPGSYTGKYMLKVTADGKQIDSDLYPLFVIVKKTEEYEESLAVGESLDINCYTQPGNAIKYIINGKEVEAGTLKLKDGNDFTDNEGIVFKVKIWETTVTENSDGVYQCQGFLGDNMIADSKVTFNVLVFSDEVTYRAEEFGDKVQILCYQVVQEGAFMKYYYQDQLENAVSPERGNEVEKGGKKYQELFWVIEKLTEENQGKYKCESYVLEETSTKQNQKPTSDKQKDNSKGSQAQKLVSMTTELKGYTLTAEAGVLTDQATVEVPCSYQGPSAGKIAWSVDGKLVDASSSDITSSGASSDRKDGLKIKDLTQASTLKIVKCEYTISGNYAKKVSKEVLVSFAKLSKIEKITNYNADDFQIDCEYTGSDKPTITWYHNRDPEKPTPITSTNIKDKVHIIKKTEGQTQKVELHLSALGHRAVPLVCNIEFIHNTREGQPVLKYVNKQQTTLKRIGFIKQLPENIMSLPKTITIECSWGSSDVPVAESTEWRINGNAPLVDFSTKEPDGLKMTTKLKVNVKEDTDNTYTCMFEDKGGTKAQSIVRVYGAKLTIDKGKEFYPTLDDNVATCVLVSKGTGTLSWIKDGKAVVDSESQKAGKVKDKTAITLTSVKLNPDLDGKYSCQVTAYGETFSRNITLAHTGVMIAGPHLVVVRESKDITLDCTAASAARIGKVWWEVNGNRISKRKYVSSGYENKRMTSKLTTNPVADALQYNSKELDYYCVAGTAAGTFKESVEVQVYALRLTPDTVVALTTTWQLKCTVISLEAPKHVVFKKGDVEKKRWTGIQLKSGEVQTRSDEKTGPKPGDDNYVVGDGQYAYRQDGNDFFINVTESTYKDAGTYTCQLIYEKTDTKTEQKIVETSEATSTVKVRSIVSPQPAVYYVPKATVTLTCLIYHDSESPKSGSWYYKGSEVKNSESSSGSNPTKHITTHIVENPALTNAGDYKCEFKFEDNSNPSYTINLQFAELKLITEKSVTIESGGRLELKASIYSSNLRGYSMIWYFNGEEVSISKGFTPTSKKTGEGFEVALSNPAIDATLAGEYHVEFTTEKYPVKLVSDKITVSVIGSASKTKNVNNFGGAITLTCKYLGPTKPDSVSWTYKGDKVNTDKWTVTEGTFTSNAQESKIEASSMTVADSGEYDCTFKVGSIAVTTKNIVTVRTISISKSGTQYVTTPEWEVVITVGSIENPKNIFIKRGDERVYPILERSKNGDVRTFTFKTKYDFKNRAGSEDGTYVFEAAFKDGVTLKTEPLKLIARAALTTVRDEKKIEINPTKVVSSIFTACEYSGVDKPQKTEWLLDGTVITPDDNHVVDSKSREVDGFGELKYLMVKSAISIPKPTWQDGGVYTCRFTFTDGNNVQTTVPKIIVVEGSGMPSCETFLDGEMELTCVFNTKETVEKIAWSRWRNEIDDSKFTTTAFANNKITSVLKYEKGEGKENPDASDNGRFYCKAKLVGYDDLFETSSDVRFARLTISVTPAAPHYAGGVVTIECKYNGRFQDQDVKYAKSEGEGFADPVSVHKRYYHRFKVSTETTGRYTCTAQAINLCKNVPVTGKTGDGAAFVNIEAKAPQIIKHPTDVSVSVGQNAQMSCIVPVVVGASTKIAWFKEGADNKIIWPRNKLEKEQNRWVSTLTIRSMSFNREGSYKCKATYGGVADINSNYAAVSLVAFKIDPTDTLGVLGGQAKFTCAFADTQARTLVLQTNNGDISNSAVAVNNAKEGVSTVSTGVATFSSLTENNGKGNYYCQVQGESYKSKTAKLTVLSYSQQPTDSWTVKGETAGFTVRIRRFEWDNFKVTWQKKVNDNWQDVSDGDKYRINAAKAKTWYTFINIMNYDSASEATEWRAKINFPTNEEKGLIGADLISNSAFVKNAGETTIKITKADTNEGTTFTLTCTVTTKEKPNNMRIKFNGLRKKFWENNMEFTFENNIATAIVKQEAKFWFSGKTISCETAVSYKKVSAETTFYTVTKTCPTLQRANGEITYTDKKDNSGAVIGKVATLTCDATNNYRPYKPPGVDTAVTEAECLFSDGYYSKKLTSCSKVTPIDFSLLKVGIFFRGFTDACDTPEKAQRYIDIMNGADGKECGYRNVGFPCYSVDDPRKCTYVKSNCEEVTENGSIGSKITGVFKLVDSIAVDTAARNDPNSEYNKYKKQADDFLTYYKAYKTAGKKFWSCKKDRRRRDVFERAVFGKSMGGSSAMSTTPTPTTTPTTPTTPTVETEAKVIQKTDPPATHPPATKQETALPATQGKTDPPATEKLVTTAKQQPDEEVKTAVPDQHVPDREEATVLVEEMEETFDFAEVVRVSSSESDSSEPEGYLVADPESEFTEDSSGGTTPEPYQVDDIIMTLGLPKLELSIGTLVLCVGLLAGVSIIIMMKIFAIAKKKLMSTTRKDYVYTRLGES